MRKRYELPWLLAFLLTLAGMVIAIISILCGYCVLGLAAVPILATGLVLLLRQYRTTTPLNEEALPALPKAGETLIVAYVNAPRLYAITYSLKTDPVVRVPSIPESGKSGVWRRIEFFPDHENPARPRGTGPDTPPQPGSVIPLGNDAGPLSAAGG